MLHSRQKPTRYGDKPVITVTNPSSNPQSSSSTKQKDSPKSISNLAAAAAANRLKSSSLWSKSFVDEPKTPESAPQLPDGMRSRSCDAVPRIDESIEPPEDSQSPVSSLPTPAATDVHPSGSSVSSLRTGIPRLVKRTSKQQVDEVKSDEETRVIIEQSKTVGDECARKNKEEEVAVAVVPSEMAKEALQDSKEMDVGKVPTPTVRIVEKIQPQTKESKLKSPKTPTKSPSGIPLSQKTPIRNRNIPTFRSATNTNNSKTPSSTASPALRPKRMELYRPNLETQYNMKVKRLVEMKRDLVDKQKPILELYKSLVTMRKNIWKSEKKDLSLEDIKLVDVNPEIMGNIMEGRKDENHDKERVQELRNKAKEIPKACMVLCHEILGKRCDVLENIGDVGDNEEITKRLKTYRHEVKTLENNIDKMYKRQHEEVEKMVVDYEDLIGKCVASNEEDAEVLEQLQNKLQETEHRLAQSIAELAFEKTRKVKDNERLRETDLEMNRLRDKVQALVKELDDERNKSTNQRERSSQYEHRFKSMKAKIRELEANKTEMESKVDGLNSNVRKLEEQLKQRESLHEHKTKELEKKTKGQEAIIAKLEKERQTVDARIQEKDDQIADKVKEHERHVDELNAVIRGFEDKVKEWKNTKEKMEVQCDMLRAQIADMEVYKKNFYDLSNSSKYAVDKAKAGLKTDREANLWTELESTRTALRQAQDKLEMYADEKTRFLDTLGKNCKDDSNTADHTAKLLEKENTITSLLIQKKQLSSDLHDSRLEVERQHEYISSLKQRLGVTNVENDLGELDKMVPYFTPTPSPALPEHIEDVHLQNAELRNRVTMLQQRIEQIERTANEGEKLLQFRDGLMHDLQRERNEAERKKLQIEGYMTTMKKNFDNKLLEFKDTQNEIKELQKLLEEQTKQAAENASKLTEMEQLYETVTQKKQDLQSQINDLQRQLLSERHKVEKIYNRYDSITSLGHCKHHIDTKRLQRHSLNSVFPARSLVLKRTRSSKVSKDLLNYDCSDTRTNVFGTKLIADLKGIKQSQSEFISHVKTLVNFNNFLSGIYDDKRESGVGFGGDLGRTLQILPGENGGSGKI